MKPRIFIPIVAVIGVVAVWFFLRAPPKPTDISTEVTPKLTICYNAEEQAGEKSLVAQVLQAQLKKAGIEVVLDPVPSTIYNDRLGKGQFECVLSLWYLDYDDAEGFLTDFYSKAGFRLSKYNNPKYDETYLAALFAPTETEKFAKYRDAAAILHTDLPWIPLFADSELFLLKPGAQGFRANAYQYYDYRRVEITDIHAASDVEVQTLDPAQTYDLASKHLVTQSYEGLIAMDENNRIVPALATNWQFSESGDRLTFNLRPGVLFHSSSFLQSQRQLNAGDVKASFERVIKANSPYSYIFDYVVGVEDFKTGKASGVSGFVVEGPLKFSIQLKRAFPTMLPWLLAPAAYILPAELPANYDFTKGSCGTGPFILNSWDGSEAKFVANSNYWLKENDVRLPKAKTLNIRIIKDANTQFLAYKQSELDIFNVPLPLFDAILDAQGNLKSEWSGSVFRPKKLNDLKFLGFNMQAGPWGKSPELRHRVEQAINRDEIVHQLFKGKARAETNIIPDGVAGFNQ